jgi:large subunit ribosomal protein L29
MKAKDIKQLHQKSKEELNKMLKEAQEELVRIKMEIATRKLKNTHLLMKKRHEVARIKTIIHEKELLE